MRGTKGYKIGKVDGISLHASRVAWAHVHGVWPTYEIDHFNGDNADDRIGNLRDVPNLINVANKKAYRKTSDLPPGVNRNGKRFGARVQHNNISFYLGSFDTPELASAAYLEKLTEIGFTERHGKLVSR